VRLHYSTSGLNGAVTIKIFDFAMVPVKTLLQNADRSSTIEHDEIWDGRDDYGRIVPNGVYFYRLEIGGTDPIWGKIYVIQ
jgi:flagellar hook assembly protein FlgD